MSVDAPVSSTLEDYLEAILSLTEEKGAARVRDIAAMLSVHKSTVTAALRALAERGMVHYAPYETTTLTPPGRQIAEEITHDHAVIRSFLKDILLVAEEAAERNACRMEHVMDQDVMDRLVVFARYMKRRRSGDGPFREYAENVERELDQLARARQRGG